MNLSEMTTLASIGSLPALPLGMSYPKKKNWLVGKANRSKVIRYRSKRNESVSFVRKNYSLIAMIRSYMESR